MRARLLVVAAVLAVAGLARAQGGLEVQVLSAKVVRNPVPEASAEPADAPVLQVEVLGVDRSGADLVEEDDAGTALLDVAGRSAARLLYHVSGARHRYFNGDDPRTELSSRLIFTVPDNPREQYLLRWRVSRYRKAVSSFTWMDEGRPLALPLTEERGDLKVTVEKLEIGHPAEGELARWDLDADRKGKMAADHLIVTVRFTGLLADRRQGLSLDKLAVYTGPMDNPEGDTSPQLDLSTVHHDWGAMETIPQPGALHPFTAVGIAHFLGVTALPKATRLMVEVSRLVPFEEGWAPLAFTR